MLLFIVSRTHVGRYDKLSRTFNGHPHVSVLLDRREGERRRRIEARAGTIERRRHERRQRVHVERTLQMLGWTIVDTEETPSG